MNLLWNVCKRNLCLKDFYQMFRDFLAKIWKIKYKLRLAAKMNVIIALK